LVGVLAAIAHARGHFERLFEPPGHGRPYRRTACAFAQQIGVLAHWRRPVLPARLDRLADADPHRMQPEMQRDGNAGAGLFLFDVQVRRRLAVDQLVPYIGEPHLAKVAAALAGDHRQQQHAGHPGRLTPRGVVVHRSPL
ncbi:hypothetical protein RZS08_23175, partial [Arthrospira platensis SPKY1]|nr:hypothetical protein [Arthrospira platensis SPKY1]